jgi:hypothetical protein
MRNLINVVPGLALLLAATCALARPTEEEIARLGGPDLTPIGAERAGNADGTIPEWKGGVSQPPPGWTWESPRVDLFADDKVLFTIDASNVDKYADKLSPGQVALIKTYDGYKMDIYPTRRSCTYPKRIIDEVAKSNARVASHDDECLLTGGVAGPLFPLPQDGCDVLTNGRNSVFNGTMGYDRRESQVIPTKGGSFEPLVRQQKTIRPQWMPQYPTFESLNGIAVKNLNINISPPKSAGEITLVHALTSGHFKAWTYNPGQRRVRRNPNFEYDNPNPAGEGLNTVDMVNGFSGAADRYNWKILGKKEMYIPYNSEKIEAPNLTYADIARPRYPRRDLLRYELHRVWVVEGTVRPDRRHTMPKRVFFIDEDTWNIVVDDNYDARGGLWRVGEHFVRLIYDLPACMPETSVDYDLVVGRYILSPLTNQGPFDYRAGEKGTVTEEGFEPDDLRRMGTR